MTSISACRPDLSSSAARRSTQVDTEILSVFDRSEILTPDEVRGRFSPSPRRFARQGWPPIDEVRGLVMFALDNENAARELYLEDTMALRGPADVHLGRPHPPRGRLVQHQQSGQGVRPHPEARPRRLPGAYSPDVDTVQARLNDTAIRDKASG